MINYSDAQALLPKADVLRSCCTPTRENPGRSLQLFLRPITVKIQWRRIFPYRAFFCNLDHTGDHRDHSGPVPLVPFSRRKSKWHKDL